MRWAGEGRYWMNEAANRNSADQGPASASSGPDRKWLAKTQFSFAAYLVLGFFLASGLALSVAYISFIGIAGSARLGAVSELDLSGKDALSAMMTYIGASILLALLSGFTLIYALGRHMVLGPHIALRLSREQTRESEAHARRLALVAEKASDLVIIYDRDGNIIWVNKAFEYTTGYTPDEVIGRKPGDFLTGGKSDPVTGQRIENAMRKGEPVSAQIINYSKSGREYLVEINISPVKCEDGELTNFIAVERALTERHRAERRLRDAVEILQDGFTIYDNEDGLVMFNRAYEKMLGMEGCLKEGMSLAEVGFHLNQAGLTCLDGGTVDDWAKEYARTMRSGARERTYVSRNERVLFIRDRETQQGELVSLRTDVTELREARRNAEEAGEAKSRFFANITHEVRTPLNGVIAMAELLLEGDLSELQRSGLQLISQSGSSLLTIINDILDYSKIEVGKMTIQPAPFDVIEAIEDVVALLAPEAQKQNNEIAFRFDPSMPRLILGDHGRIRQIATNLVGNAITFTSGGEIVVRLGGDQIDEDVELLLEVEDSGVGISDEGLGVIFQPFEQMDGPMRQDGSGLGLSICRQLADLMDGELSASSVLDQGSTFRFAAPFPRLEGGATVFEPLKDAGAIAIYGSGVQVESLASQIGALGGRIAAEGERPSLNVISLPRDGKMPADIQGYADAPVIIVAPQNTTAPVGLADGFPTGVSFLRRPVRTGILASNIAKFLDGEVKAGKPVVERRRKIREMDKPLVLVAEDNATNAAIIRAMLADQPIRVEIYPDGGSAVEAFERTSPAVVLMDIQLPDMTGYEATQRIWAFKEMQRRATTPIIAATASSRPEDQQACFDAGLDDFISKPLNKQQLCAKLTYWISQSDELSDDTKHRIAG